MAPKEIIEEAATAPTGGGEEGELSPAKRLQQRSAEQRMLLKRFQQKIKTSGALTSAAINQTIAKDVVEKMRNSEQQHPGSSNVNEKLISLGLRGGSGGEQRGRSSSLPTEDEVQLPAEEDKPKTPTEKKRTGKRGSWTDRVLSVPLISFSLVGQSKNDTTEDDQESGSLDENHASVFEEMENLSNSQKNAARKNTHDPRSRRHGRRGSDASVNSTSTNRRGSMTSRRSSFSDISIDDVSMRELLAEGTELKQQFGNLQARRGSFKS